MSVVQEMQARKRPGTFAPFAIVLKDGRRLPVNRPFQFAFNESRVVVLDEMDRVTEFLVTDISRFEELHPVG
ncbi:MAG TPA: hypothetical protein VER17_06565 [Tepidisphaeraceae bacterium]|nr:hypothetical protein [Tepidisphaeraceae bacterium]